MARKKREGKDLEGYSKISSPRIFLFRMLVFLVLAGLVAALLYRQIYTAFLSNPLLNGIIFGVLLIGIILAFRQVMRLFPEVNWVNGFRLADPGLAVDRAPVLLAPMATLLRDRMGRMAISQITMRGILESIGTRLDEQRDVGRYLTGLLVFLGLLGTFWGLLETVGSIGRVITALDASGDSARVFDDLKTGLAAPLAGMGIAFSSSLFGLAGSLVLGFLDLQASQAQNRFYTDLEDWLSTTVADLGVIESDVNTAGAAAPLAIAIQRLEKVIEAAGGERGSKAMVNLAGSLQELVQHMRTEQQMLRDWVEGQAERQNEIRDLVERLSREDAGVRRR
jgi:hypothetical protein